MINESRRDSRMTHRSTNRPAHFIRAAHGDARCIFMATRRATSLPCDFVSSVWPVTLSREMSEMSVISSGNSYRGMEFLRESGSLRESRLNSDTSCIMYVSYGRLNIFINIPYCGIRAADFAAKSAFVKLIPTRRVIPFFFPSGPRYF